MNDDLLREICCRLSSIETKLELMPCADHTQKLEKLQLNGQYRRGLLAGLLFAASLLGGGVVAGIERLLQLFAPGLPR